MTPRILILLMLLQSGAQAQIPEPSPAKIGNLPAEFYIKPGCTKPDRSAIAHKPSYDDWQDVASYNSAILRYNGQAKAFNACMGEYVRKASHDIEWIEFTVNAAVANVNRASPPPPPTALGNMPSGFYPSPECILPSKQPGNSPDTHDSQAMKTYNQDVSAFNALAQSFNICIKGFVSRASNDIERIKGATSDAVAQTR